MSHQLCICIDNHVRTIHELYTWVPRCRSLPARARTVGFSTCCGDLQCVAACCSVLQCITVCCGVSLCVAMCRRVLQYHALCCCVLQYVAVRCSAWQCSAPAAARRAACRMLTGSAMLAEVRAVTSAPSPVTSPFALTVQKNSEKSALFLSAFGE